MSSTMPRVSIVLLNWNSYAVTLDCVLSLRKLDYPNYEVLLVDNGSKDASPDRLAAAAPELRLLRSETNLGFAGGCNIGIRDAVARGADYVLLLNNDTLVAPDFLTQLIRVAESDPQIGVLNPKILSVDPPGLIDYGGGVHTAWRLCPKVLGQHQKDEGQCDELREVTFLTGCALLVKAEVIRRVGVLELVYFHLMEDVEWSLRALRAGYKGMYVPQSLVWHKGHTTVKHHHDNGFLEFYFTRNNIIFLRKHLPRYQWPLKMSWMCAYALKRTAMYALAGDWANVKALYRGFWAGSTERLPQEDTRL